MPLTAEQHHRNKGDHNEPPSSVAVGAMPRMEDHPAALETAGSDALGKDTTSQT